MWGRAEILQSRRRAGMWRRSIGRQEDYIPRHSSESLRAMSSQYSGLSSIRCMGANGMARFLQSETFFAVAQKKYVYIYDTNGVELQSVEACHA